MGLRWDETQEDGTGMTSLPDRRLEFLTVGSAPDGGWWISFLDTPAGALLEIGRTHSFYVNFGWGLSNKLKLRKVLRKQ